MTITTPSKIGLAPHILLIDKPSGITSFDVIRRLQRLCREADKQPPKMGHAGTLDPLASGLMLIGIGSGTKELTKLIKLPKVYEAEILFGIKTDSGDVTGQILEKNEGFDPKLVSEASICKTLTSMIGTLELAVPIYSAIKRDGRKLYELAREGQTVGEIIPPKRNMTITEASLLSWSASTCTVRFAVSSGTYIRSLAEHLGERLGVPATLKNLRRTQIGDYTIGRALRLDSVTSVVT